MSGSLRIRRIGDEAWHDLSDAGFLPEGFLREAAEYELFFSMPGGSTPPALEMSDGIITPAELTVSPEGCTGRWNWSIDHYAGEVELRARAGDTRPFSALLDVAPHPFKLGKHLHAELLMEVQEMAEGLAFGFTAGHTPLVEEARSAPAIAQYCLFNAFSPLLAATFARIADRPHRRLRGFRENVALHQVRRCDAQTVVRAARSPHARSALNGRGRSTGGDVRLNVHRMENSHDTALNRYVCYLLGCLMAGSQNLADALEVYRCDLPEVESRAHTWGARMRETRRTFLAMGRSHFLENVPPRLADPSAMIAAARHPDYARFVKLCRMVLHPAVALGQADDTTITLRPTYELYEYWCFLRLATMLPELFPNMKWSSFGGTHPTGLLCAIPDGSTVLGCSGDCDISLTFQQTYRHTPNHAPDPFSISTEFRPDFVLSVRRGTEQRLVIFDAKYRSSDFSIKEALRDMHVYRDAIRSEPTRSAVDAAFILVPDFRPGMSRFFDVDYRQKYEFGGFRLTPGGEHDPSLRAEIKREVESIG